MRFLMRAITGAILLALTAGFLILGATPYLGCAPGLADLGFRCAADKSGGSGGGHGRAQSERILALRALTIELGDEIPRIRAYGDVRARRELEIRAEEGGRVTKVDPNFRSGGEVAAGDLLYAVDPTDARANQVDARAQLREARAEAVAALRSVELARRQHDRAQRQQQLRRSALERRRALAGRGVAAEAMVEEAELALADAERAGLTAEQTADAEKLRAENAAVGVTRAEIVLRDADRSLENTVFRAPFDAVVADAALTVGALVSVNERIGALYDPTALEVGFRVSDADFARLLSADGALAPRPAKVFLSLGEIRIEAAAEIDRIAGRAAPAEGGRLVFARLSTASDGALRPGDFVRVEIIEPALEDVARLPASAVGASGRVLVINLEGVLEARAVTLLRRDGDDVLVRGDLDGAMVALDHGPQLTPGQKARPLGVEPAQSAPEIDLVTLDLERREKLIAFVKTARRMPEDRRQRLLAMLAEGAAPRAVIGRLEARMARRAARQSNESVFEPRNRAHLR